MRQTKAEILEGINPRIIVSSKFVDNNTLEIEYDTGAIAYRLHNTDVVTYDPRGQIVLNSGGWKTHTTKERINDFTPKTIRLTQENSIWYANGYSFYDGITFNDKGKLVSDNKPVDEKEVKRIKRKIAGFVKNITEDNLPVPDSGDCWICMIFESNDTDHLWSHIEENYVHGTLLVNAMREYGYDDEQIGMHYSMRIADTFRRAVRKYLQKRLLNI